MPRKLAALPKGKGSQNPLAATKPKKKITDTNKVDNVDHQDQPLPLESQVQDPTLNASKTKKIKKSKKITQIVSASVSAGVSSAGVSAGVKISWTSY